MKFRALYVHEWERVSVAQLIGVQHETSPRLLVVLIAVFFFFQAEDGIRDLTVTGVQTCALPISLATEGAAPNIATLVAPRRINEHLVNSRSSRNRSGLPINWRRSQCDLATLP